MKKQTWMLLCACLCMSAHAMQTEYYRYQDASGDMIISNTIPPEYANQGYDIVSPRGNVIRHVPAKRNQAEIEAEKKAQQALEDAKRAAEKKLQAEKEQAAQDKVLLQMFSSLEDVKRSRDQKVQAIEVVESITKDSIERQQSILESDLKSAEHIKTSGSVVPEKLNKRIQSTKTNIAESEAFLRKKATEKKDLHLKYEKLIERFKSVSETE